MSLRALEPRDVEGVLKMWEALLHNGQRADLRFCPAPDARDAFRAYVQDVWLRREPFAHCLVAEDDALVGFISGFPSSTLPVVAQPPTARIGDLWVEPSHRRRGLAGALVRAFTDGARAGGHPQVDVGTLTRDERAVAFWRAQGFDDWQVTLRRS